MFRGKIFLPAAIACSRASELLQFPAFSAWKTAAEMRRNTYY
jgi:hypothetical protein